MARFRAPDWLLIGVLIPIGVLVSALHVRSVRVNGMPRLPFLAIPAASPTDYPAASIHREVASPDLEVQAGDRLLRAGAVDLRGVGHLEFEAIVRSEAGASGVLPVQIERNGRARTVEVRLASQVAPWSNVPFQVSFLLIALLILLRAPGTRQARLTVVALCGMVIWHTRFHASYAESYASLVLLEVAAGPAIAGILYWAIHFPAEVPRHRRAPRALALIGLAWPLSRASRYLGGPLTIDESQVARALVEVCFIVVLMGVLTRNYRSADPIGQRRIKWLLVGLYVGVFPILVALTLSVLVPELGWFNELVALGWVLMVAVPLGLLVGIARHNLFDIDRVISATASYSALGAGALVLALVALPRLASAGSELVGMSAQTVQLVLIVGVAALVVPLHRRLGPRIERLFFPERRTLELGFDALVESVWRTTTTPELARIVGEQLDALLRPQSCAAFAAAEEGIPYTPIFVHGAAVPPSIEPTHPVVARLRARIHPVVLEGDGVRHDRACADLARRGAAVLVPVRRGEALPVFLYLGPKRSGDVYTSTDLARLTALASAISAKLLAFDGDALMEEARSMQDALRRYVPGAIADRLMTGESLDSVEREVSVMFVDIRGYTTLSQGRRAEEVFSMVNRYTQVVSEIVRAHGGSVVEFAGDGLMAIFGAPQDLAHKERAAVRAAREIYGAVAMLRVDPASGVGLSVGVGIATGAAFVGNIQAADRLIWSALGNTTNLAARLQALTRDLDAAVVIDATTCERAAEEARAFVAHRETAIKGLRDTCTVHALPRHTSEAAGRAA